MEREYKEVEARVAALEKETESARAEPVKREDREKRRALFKVVK